MPLVSICIPTYNRASNLKQTIDSIVDNKEFLDGTVEIIVSNNVSMDNTEKLCSGYKKFDNFKYYRNEKNVIDENFYLVLKKANGIYRKLHNDSFVFNSVGLSYICEKVEKYKSDKPTLFFTTDAINIGEEELRCGFSFAVKKISYWLTCLNVMGFWETDIPKLIYDKTLFNKFLYDLVNLKAGLLNNYNNEDFEAELVNAYSKKDYWDEFIKKYHKELFIRNLKENIKKIINRR